MKLTIEQIEQMVQEAMKRWQVQKRYRGHAEPEDIERDEAEGMHNIDSLEKAQDVAQKKQDIEYAIDAKRRKGVKVKKKALTKKQRQRKATEKDQMKLPFINEQYSPEQEKKILTLIKKTRNLMIELQAVQGFFPTIINSVYYFDDIERPIKDMTTGPLGKKAVKKHYSAMQRITKILEEVNQYLYLLESLEIEGKIALTAKEMIYGDLTGPTTAVGHSVKLDELAKTMDTGITFLEDVQEFVPGSLDKGNLGLEAMRDIAESFKENYKDLKDYLESMQ